MSRLSVCVLAFSITALVNTTSADRIAAVDFVFANSNGTGFFGDHFDNGVLEPIWEVVNGSPGPEAGTTLDLNGGDLIVAPLNYDSNTDLAVVGLFDLSGMNPGEVASVILYGDTRNDFVSFIFGNGTAFVIDETAALLGATNYTGDQGTVVVNYNADGSYRAEINQAIAFDGDSGAFGGATELGLLAIPEPGTLALLLVGAGVATMRRRSRG